MHFYLDFGPDPTDLDLDYVCRLTDEFKYGSRVAIGHVTKLSAADPNRFLLIPESHPAMRRR